MDKFFKIVVILIAFGPATGCASDIYNQATERTEARGLGQFSSYKPAQVTEARAAEPAATHSPLVTQRSREAVLGDVLDIPNDVVIVDITFNMRYGRNGREHRARNCLMWVADAGRMGNGSIPCDITFAGTEQIIEFRNDEGQRRHLRVKDILGNYNFGAKVNDLCRATGVNVRIGRNAVCGSDKREQAMFYTTRAERSLFMTGK